MLRHPVGVAFVPSKKREAATSRLYVAESAGKRVQVLTGDGTPLQTIAPPAPDGRLGGLCLATRGGVDPLADPHRLIVLGKERHKLYVFKRGGRYADGLG